ncbi:multidrug transporter [Paenibacillus glucanolyticus]|uniref:Multidrug transporter n=1 Tax=Paenibacillus glucanolyticus TaxID=59843 RepID=A0A163LU56_9BACL|nr:MULTISPECIES: DMT family transporter [Paenibacillus]KZS48470.1 multidrug transporter [Paenibacillus glucanolyticus]MDH6672207.1 drug/metabolite transporter (DMT)-like permease [Paenibacillus sp. LBL]
MKPLKADLMILFITICWGSSYLFMKMGLDTLGEFNLIALRFGLAFILAAAIFYPRLRQVNLRTIRYAMLLGSILFIMFTALTFGLKTTTTSNAGFLISLTVVFVPLIHTFLFKKKIEKKLIASILLALTGIALLTIQLPFTFKIGDLFCIAAALCYALHINVVSSAAQKVDTLSLGILQLGFTGLYAFVMSFILETPVLPSTTHGWIAILVLSVVCSALGFILQTIAQKYTTATRTGLVFSLEPVFAAMFGFWFAHEIMNSVQYFGAALVFLSVVIASVEVNTLKRSNMRNRPRIKKENTAA